MTKRERAAMMLGFFMGWLVGLFVTTALIMVFSLFGFGGS